MLDEPRTIETSTELRDLAQVARRALLMIVAYWDQATSYPRAHPYRQAAAMLIHFIEQRYGTQDARVR